MRVTNKTAVQSLLFLLQERDIQNIVYSPGSRNAPFAIALDGHVFFKVHIKVDERSAAFFALGMAQQLGKPVALICTSGTAPLNYAPAIAEAYYQEIPLVVITADRPAESINQSEGQCINQIGIYNNFIKAEYNIIEEAEDEQEVVSNHRELSKVLNQALQFPLGPVHINTPFKEPLYKEQSVVHSMTSVKTDGPGEVYSTNFPEFNRNGKYLVLMGQNTDDSIAPFIKQLTLLNNVTVLTETHSNVHALGGIDCIDRWVMSLSATELESLHWDVVISLGHNVISRKIKTLIKSKAQAHWSVQWQDNPIDTYRLSPLVIQSSIYQFLSNWVSQWSLERSEDSAQTDDENPLERLEGYFQNRPFSDLKFFFTLSKSWPLNAQVQMGNSSAVRYIQLFEQRRDLRFYGNRGVSGIDGSTSTAVGAAAGVEKDVVLVTGDLSFLYDANGLWHQPWPNNLKIIVVDNGGGGIFKIIDGAKSEPSVPQFFETPHQRDLVRWVEGWGLKAIEFNEASVDGLKHFFTSQEIQVLVVKTPAEVNPIELDLFFEYFRKKNERVENN
ncbi:MAG: hypothetical protein RLZZ205_1000 [Bacteroidota bacterium]|jgi:2-succinyl-5-enolpyruvyl-6-hydroxy-3-cyclohexene-1-carboxylate synthase